MSRSALPPRPGAIPSCAEPVPAVNEDDGDGTWVVIGREAGLRELAFQRATDWVAPGWPDPERPQQRHLDIRVDDVDAAEQAVVAHGATPLRPSDEEGFRVYADPAGHPFCLVF